MPRDVELDQNVSILTVSPMRRRQVGAPKKYVISDSDSDNDKIRAPSKVQNSNRSRGASRVQPEEMEIIDLSSDSEPAEVRLDFPTTPDIRYGEDGMIDYIPSPRKPRPLSPAKQLAEPARRRTLLEPDPVDEELKWEVQKEAESDIISGMRVMRRSIGHKDAVDSASDVPPPPSRPTNALDVAGVIDSTEFDVTEAPPAPTKTPRLKKMPDAVAALHRLAIAFLKEMDAVVFKNRLGSTYLPDLEPAPAGPSKRRGKNQTGIIYGLGSRGDYNDGLGSYIELVWSNRMATTAGRTDYRKSSNGKTTTKIELGVKILTTEAKLRNTLAHEACHAATWAISEDFKQPHGATFKKWASRVMAAFPDVEITTRHDYEIEYKFSWKCLNTNCGQVYQRHSNSINVEKHGCHCGSRLQPQFTLPAKRARKGDESPSKASRMQLSGDVDALALALKVTRLD
ncbi:HMG box-containing protein C19G7.04 [Serendipita indica DSM 11827]|nr:HMG box-containing protein C19G7.04 [Serendipita indica DSM 11827]